MGFHIRVPRGADFVQACSWTRVDGTAVDLTTYALSCRVKAYPWRATANVTPVVAVVSAPAGTFTVTFTNAQTSTMARDDYVWEVLATKSGLVSRLLSGRVLMVAVGDDLAQPSSVQRAVLDPLN